MNIVKNILKTIAAGIVAVGILSLIFSFYYLQPAHIDNTEGNTDYVWIANSRWLKMTEGISLGRFDADGYNNPEVVKKPDIIVLGSSHTEATNVNSGKDFSSVLRNKLEGEYSVYNMGISGHNFLKICKYLPQNLERYETVPKAVIIETDNLTFPLQEVEALLEGRIAKSPSYNTGIIALSQRSPFFSVLYNQIQGGLIKLLTPDRAKLIDLASREKTAVPVAAQSPAAPVINEDEVLAEAYSRMFDYIGQTISEYDTEIIIFYHPAARFQQDGSVKFTDHDIKPAFIENCKKHGITFVDMTDSFDEMWKNGHKVPHGFVTGKTAFGHLNADGHAAVGDALYQTIMQLEREGRL